MTDAPTPTPLVLPDRPDPDDIVASTWGQWVHDEIANRGMKARAEVVTNQPVPAAWTDLTGLTVTFTALAGRWYRVAWHLLFVPLAAGATCLSQVLEGTTTLQSVQAYQGTTGGCTNAGSVVRQFSAGAHTLKLQGFVNVVGGGNLLAATTSPAQLIVDDVGAV